jgi:hypothetical protein
MVISAIRRATSRLVEIGQYGDIGNHHTAFREP